jgi:citrate synthase
MGRLTFGEAIYLLFMGEVPSPGIGRLMEAILVSFIDHGVTPPSALAARYTATTGAPLRAWVAAGVLGFGRHHGGDIESCMQFLDQGLELVRKGAPYREAAAEIVNRCESAGEPIPGFGHRFHTRDPRAARLFQLVLELEVESEHIRMIRAVEQLLVARAQPPEKPLPVNVDGAIAAICGDLGLNETVANALFVISRVPGLIAHAIEEQALEKPLRVINPAEHVYVGPGSRRLPQTRR